MKKQIACMVFDSGVCSFGFKRCVVRYRDKIMVIYSSDSIYHMSVEICFDDEDKDSLSRDEAFDLVHDFLYKYGWANGCSFHYLDSCAMSGNESVMLSKQNPLFRIRKVILSEKEFSKLLLPDCNEVLKKAITAYNDGNHSNDKLYAFLCFYKVIDLFCNGKSSRTVKWINNNIGNLVLNNRRLELYLENVANKGEWLRTLRNRIAHIVMNDKSDGVISGRASELDRINFGTSLIQKLAKYIIKQKSNLIEVPIDILDKQCFNNN